MKGIVLICLLMCFAGCSDDASTGILSQSSVDIRSGLLAQYTFEGNANDISGNGRNGTVHDALLCPGKIGQGYSFDGVRGYIDIGGFPQCKELTISAWILVNGSTGDFQSIVSSEDAPPDDLDNSFVHFQLHASGNNAVFVNEHDCLLLPVVQDVPHRVWRHVALTCKSGELCLYENGVLLSKGTETFDYIRAARKVRIGSGNERRRFFNGWIDEVRIYNRALTPGDIAALSTI